MSEVTMENLEMVYAFEDWAAERGYSTIRTEDKSQYASFETHAAWLGFEAAHGEAGCKPYGQQLYAHIKKDSEYSHQSDKLFPVAVGKAPYNDFVVHGGPGGVYRIRDVSFYVISDGKQYRLS
jgi:hypothetical protein